MQLSILLPLLCAIQLTTAFCGRGCRNICKPPPCCCDCCCCCCCYDNNDPYAPPLIDIDNGLLDLELSLNPLLGVRVGREAEWTPLQPTEWTAPQHTESSPMQYEFQNAPENGVRYVRETIIVDEVHELNKIMDVGPPSQLHRNLVEEYPTFTNHVENMEHPKLEDNKRYVREVTWTPMVDHDEGHISQEKEHHGEKPEATVRYIREVTWTPLDDHEINFDAPETDKKTVENIRDPDTGEMKKFVREVKWTPEADVHDPPRNVRQTKASPGEDIYEEEYEDEPIDHTRHGRETKWAAVEDYHYSSPVSQKEPKVIYLDDLEEYEPVVYIRQGREAKLLPVEDDHYHSSLNTLGKVNVNVNELEYEPINIRPARETNFFPVEDDHHLSLNSPRKARETQIHINDLLDLEPVNIRPAKETHLFHAEDDHHSTLNSQRNAREAQIHINDFLDPEPVNIRHAKEAYLSPIENDHYHSANSLRTARETHQDNFIDYDHTYNYEQVKESHSSPVEYNHHLGAVDYGRTARDVHADHMTHFREDHHIYDTPIESVRHERDAGWGHGAVLHDHPHVGLYEETWNPLDHYSQHHF